MFELPELTTIARQMNVVLKDKTVREGRLGNAPHKFVWYDRTHDEFARLTQSAVVGGARARGVDEPGGRRRKRREAGDPPPA